MVFACIQPVADAVQVCLIVAGEAKISEIIEG